MLAVAVAALLSLPAVPSHAEWWSDTEPGGDAISTVYDFEAEPCPTSTTTPTTEGDIRRLTVRHTSDAVVVRMRITGLLSAHRTFGDLTVRTARRDWSVTVTRFGKATEVGLSRLGTPPPDDGSECGSYVEGADVRPCRDARGVIDVAARLIEASIPRRCLGSPRWVRAGGAVATWHARTDAIGYDQWAPPGVADGDGWVPPLSPRVRVGRP